ncbi:unnamed protein product [Callosobruchus maculatus]|uniref:Uncharacterized protein n=1 Tax=Callosobruchus maculatus TaxID=64391 RepID=A0A653BIT2_CALMS|nr:unnamed protein product [Callosobruchus maculatus]
MWMNKRDSFPSNYKRKIYSIFNDGMYCLVSDEDVLPRITMIYKQLLIWASKYEKMKEEKYHKFKNGEDVELDEEDEELFLSAKEKYELTKKRNRILRRMVPPDGPRNWRLD